LSVADPRDVTEERLVQDGVDQGAVVDVGITLDLSMGVLESVGILAAVVIAAVVGLVVWALVSVLATPSSVWRAAGRSQVRWVLLILVFPLVGSLAYLAMARPDLRSRAR
jgi:hypothetical protein